jgi:hypothetical protein
VKAAYIEVVATVRIRVALNDENEITEHSIANAQRLHEQVTVVIA